MPVRGRTTMSSLGGSGLIVATAAHINPKCVAVKGAPGGQWRRGESREGICIRPTRGQLKGICQVSLLLEPF